MSTKRDFATFRRARAKDCRHFSKRISTLPVIKSILTIYAGLSLIQTAFPESNFTPEKRCAGKAVNEYSFWLVYFKCQQEVIVNNKVTVDVRRREPDVWIRKHENHTFCLRKLYWPRLCGNASP